MRIHTDPTALPSAAQQWPPPVEVLNETGRSPIVLICEHASNHIPAEYERLGLDDSELARHIAWDIGAAAVTRQLSKRLDAAAFLATYSRLLVDLNRPPRVAASMPVLSEATDIPGNRALAQAERDRRVQLIFDPFHERIRAHLDKREPRTPILIFVHSFTPVYLGQSRPWHAGVLFDKGAALADSIIASLRSDPALNVDANVPYGVSPDEDYGLLVHGDDRGNAAVLIEIRNDLIADPAGVEQWTQRLEDTLRLR
jgi:predicted N-formylglutamate amidohydrolase